jgi:CubicO group peptidase (beta-lactamase class C family)
MKSTLMAKFICSFIMLFIILVFACAEEKNDKTAEMDKIFAKWDSTITPGMSIAIIKDGEIIYERGYGMANLDLNIANSPITVFRIGSTSKQFTAACIAILSLQGKLSLDDNIRKYVPEMPEYEKPITIRHLIHHTSGLRDYLTLEYLAGKSDFDYYTPKDSVAAISRQKALNFLPGEEYLYSNSGYFLLGVIVERVSGKSLNDFAQEHIFKPLGMKNTHFHDDHTMIVKNRASGYSPTKNGFRIDMTSLDHVGDGGVFTTVEDLYLWDQNFYDNKIQKGLLELIHTRGSLNNGKELDYAFGLGITDYKGLKMVSHGGAFVGYRAEMIRFPEERFSVICLANLSAVNPSKLCRQVADIYLADKLKEKKVAEKPKEELKPVTLPKEVLEEKVGNYQDEKGISWVSIYLKDDNLMVEAYGEELPLTPVSRSHFIAVDAPFDVSVEFIPEEGKPQKAKATIEGDETTFIKAPDVSPLTAKQLQEYAGNYYSDELPATYRLVVEEGKLFLKYRNLPEDAFKLMAPDKFNLKMLNFHFIRNEMKEITGFKLNAGRVRIEFGKEK